MATLKRRTVPAVRIPTSNKSLQQLVFFFVFLTVIVRLVPASKLPRLTFRVAPFHHHQLCVTFLTCRCSHLGLSCAIVWLERKYWPEETGERSRPVRPQWVSRPATGLCLSISMFVWVCVVVSVNMLASGTLAKKKKKRLWIAEGNPRQYSDKECLFFNTFICLFVFLEC